MRFKTMLAILIMLAPFTAEAGGKRAVKATMYEASVYDVWLNYPTEPPIIRGRTLGDGAAVGSVNFNATANDKMNITIKLKDGPANATFDVVVFPATFDLGDGATLTTNKKGKGSVTLRLDIPQVYVDAGVARIKVVLVGADQTYATDSRDPPFVNPPADPNPGSTAHEITLK